MRGKGLPVQLVAKLRPMLRGWLSSAKMSRGLAHSNMYRTFQSLFLPWARKLQVCTADGENGSLCLLIVDSVAGRPGWVPLLLESVHTQAAKPPACSRMLWEPVDPCSLAAT